MEIILRMITEIMVLDWNNTWNYFPAWMEMEIITTCTIKINWKI